MARRQARQANPCRCGSGCRARKLPPKALALIEPMAASWVLATGSRWSSGEFRCPLCLRELPISCVTLAHAPSARLGGRVVGLLCKACNSFLGTKYEAYLSVDADRAIGSEVLRARPASGLGSFVVRADTKFDPKTRHHDMTLRAAGRKREFDAAMKRLNSQGGIHQLGLGPFSPLAASGGVLAWAYLSGSGQSAIPSR